jgi:hypothetical protein
MFLVFNHGIIGYKKRTRKVADRKWAWKVKRYNYLCTLYIPPNTPIHCRYFCETKLNEIVQKRIKRGWLKQQAMERVHYLAKLRAPEAEVLEITEISTNRKAETVDHNSTHAPEAFRPTDYTVGETVVAPNWEDRLNKTCSGGIHFFLDKQRALNW